MIVDYLMSWWAATGGLVLVLAMAAGAVHAVQTKRDTRAAVGWVGLIWFAPVVGLVLYFLFGINRIQRRAKRELADSPHVETPHVAPRATPEDLRDAAGPSGSHLTRLNRLTDNLSGLPLVAGNQVEPLVGGKQAYDAMLEAIRGARRSVTLLTYLFDRTGVGARFREALVEAHRRGVEVRVMVDDVGARYSFPPATRALRRRRIPVARFMRTLLPWRFRYYNLRNHRKIMVVDGRIGFTGGMNIRRQYAPEDTDEPHDDLHFRLEGPVVAHLQWIFAEDWIFTTGERLQGNRWFPELEPRGTTLARGIPHGPDDDHERLRWVLVGALGCARDTVRVITPYFLPDDEIQSALCLAAMRGVDVEVLLPKRSNLRMVDWASRAGLEPLVRRGVTVVFASPPFDHSKLFLVDGCWSLIGSTNWDPRSLSLNFEFNVECYGDTLTGRLEELYRSKRSKGSPVELDELRSRNPLSRFRDNVMRLFSPYL